MKPTRDRERRSAREGFGRAEKGALRVGRRYSRPELTSYGNLVELTRTVGGGDPDGLIGTIGT